MNFSSQWQLGVMKQWLLCLQDVDMEDHDLRHFFRKSRLFGGTWFQASCFFFRSFSFICFTFTQSWHTDESVWSPTKRPVDPPSLQSINFHSHSLVTHSCIHLSLYCPCSVSSAAPKVQSDLGSRSLLVLFNSFSLFSSSFDQRNCLLQSSMTVWLLRTAITSEDNFSVVYSIRCRL